MVPLLLHRKRIANLFKITRHFWNPEDFPDVLPTAERIYKNTYYFLSGYLVLIYLTLVIFYVQPFFKLELMMVCHVPEQIPYAFWIILILQYPTAFMSASSMGGFDTMYVAFFTHLVVQLKCLNSAIRNMKVDSHDFNKTLKKNIDHHRFILA